MFWMVDIDAAVEGKLHGRLYKGQMWPKFEPNTPLSQFIFFRHTYEKLHRFQVRLQIAGENGAAQPQMSPNQVLLTRLDMECYFLKIRWKKKL